jgi:hypothetical protein
MLEGRLWGLLWLLCAVPASAQSPARWWLGFLDSEGRAYLELPRTSRDCAERDRTVRDAGIAPGMLVRARRSPGEYLPQGARLAVTVADFDGQASERVVTRVVGLAREDEGRPVLLPGACWFLAEPRIDALNGTVQEDRPLVGVHPPRALAVRRFDAAWRGFGDAPRLAGDSRFRGDAELPDALRQRITALLPGADQTYAQAFEAVVEPGRPARALWLAGGVAQAEGAAGDAATFRTLNLILPGTLDRVSDRVGPAALFQAGPTAGLGQEARQSYVAQVAAVVDLDGDGIDEIILRARYYAGGNFKVLRWNGARYVIVHDGAYEGE